MGNCNLNCCNNQPKAPNPYTFRFTSQHQLTQNTQQFETNKVRTSKYTILSFFPLALISQFMRLANVYFLIIAILQTVPQIAPLSVYTAWVPLIIVLAISMFRQAVQDIARCRQDSHTNFDSKAMVRRNGQWVEVSWSEVVVGEILIVEQDQLFPADLILLASAVPGGNAFIETASLDGQKNLKPRMSPQQFAPFRQNNNIDQLSGQCTCSAPNRSLSNFSSTIVLSGNQQRIIIEGEKQLLYRGAKLKNTKWIYGLVAYTGRNTKIMLNSQNHRNKMSQIEIKVNKLLIIIFIFQVILCIVCAVCFGVQTNRQNSGGYWYLQTIDNVAGQSVLIFFSYLVLFNTMIPISLIVSLEIVKAVQAMFIQNDVLMFSRLRNRGCKVFSASLNQELGQVQYVFTDKTGTLTLNVMEFKIAVIGQTLYGDTSLISDSPNAQPPPQKLPEGVKGFYDQKLIMLLSGAGQSKQIKQIQILDSNKQPAQTISNERQLANEYMLALSVAHQVVLDKDKDGNSTYQGPSPDEITLVQAAKNTGYTFIRTDNQYSYVKIGGKDERFQLLAVNPFTSDRKRMSVIARINGKIKLFIKGADSIIKKRLAPNQIYMDSIDKHLHTFAVKGLRTLLVAEKILTDQQYTRYKQAEQNLPQKDREKHRQKLVSELQNGLTLIGATAVLDRLQDNVPQTIRDLIQANIKVWMLTGDKLQTAQNIAISCNLIQSHFQILKFQPRTQNLEQQLRRLAASAEGYTASGVKKAFLIEGEHLGILFQSEACKQIIANMAQYCEAVVCCRLLPLQKAEVVKLVKDHLNKITLAIGDGANDVPMITTAHIGIGLYGQEGMGSVSASDYALPQFQCLWRLLLVHGRWNYLRISEMILYFFYKNMMFTIPQFFFAFYSSYSAQTIFDDAYVSLFNLIFTALPLVIKAVLQQDVYYIYNTQTSNQPFAPQDPLSLLPNGFQQKNSLRLLFPNIYYLGQENKIFHYRSFFWWTFQGILTGLLITLMCIYTLSGTSLNATGINVDLWSVSITIYSCIILAVTFKLATHTRFWSILTFIGTVIISLGLYVAFMWISNVNSSYVQGSIMPIYRSFYTWLLVFYVIGILLVFDGIFVYYKFICGGDTSRMRNVVENDRISDWFYYQEIGLKPGQAKQKLPSGTLDVLYN